MAKLQRHPIAEQDLIEIFDYIARDNEKIAESFVRRLNQKCEVLARAPNIGRARPDIRADLRSFPVGAYLILFRAIDDGVEIVRVVHAARNLDDLV